MEGLVDYCNKFYRVIISSERKINEKYKEYVFKGNPEDFTHLMYYAVILVTDSATMASEASIMGTPNVLINKVGKQCGVNKDLFIMDCNSILIIIAKVLMLSTK